MHLCTWKGIGKLPSLVPVCDCYFGLRWHKLANAQGSDREENTSFPRVIGVFYFSYGNKMYQFLKSEKVIQGRKAPRRWALDQVTKLWAYLHHKAKRILALMVHSTLGVLV
jgi:hypothetical protein